MQRLPRREVHVWALPPGCRPGPGDLARLTDVERARAEALPEASADGFVLGRSLLRGVLGRLLWVDPARVSIDATCSCGAQHGRPVVVGPARLHAGLTRSGPRVLVAVAGAPLGVDLVAVADVLRVPLADVALGTAGAAWWEAEGRDGTALARGWARREAVLKAAGSGLRVEPSAVHVHGDRARLGRGVPRTFHLLDLPVVEGEVGAVAISARPLVPRPRLVMHDGEGVLA